LAVLAFELVADRVLAPFVGVSLYTWTSIIGVTMVGLSAGAWIGGRLADRRPRFTTLAGLLLGSAAILLLSFGLVRLIGDAGPLQALPSLARIFLLSGLLLIPAATLLGAVTPLAVRLALDDLQRAGRTVGSIYALATLGSLAGNFLTGFVLVARLPVTTIFVAVAALLLVLAAFAWLSRGASPAASSAGAEDAPAPVRAPEQGVALPIGDKPAALCAVAAAGSFCTMILELSASRILAPYVGVSIYSWTGIIGVVLAGMALGNYVGGRYADRGLGQRGVARWMVAGGFATMTIVPLAPILGGYEALAKYELLFRVTVLALAIFAAPVFLLGTLSPQLVRLAIGDVAHAGRLSGRIYAWSTAGAIAGTFLTGWVLISTLGVFLLVMSAGLALIVMGLVLGFGPGRQRRLELTAAAAAIWAAVVYGGGVLNSPCTLETNYFCIRVEDGAERGEKYRYLYLDRLIHTYIKLDDPTFLGYEHENIQSAITREWASKIEKPRALVIGGGGYSFPRWVERYLPQVHVDVVEIDPGVTEIAYRELQLPRDTRIVSYNMDGRQFVKEHASPGAYDLIVQDAVNDLSIPYH
ncbi:MAG: fused MFS/spermidine synthase, partial [Myxococcales bacterium]